MATKLGRPKIELSEEEKKEKYENYKKNTNERIKKDRSNIKHSMEDHIPMLLEKFPNSKIKATSFGITIKLNHKDLQKLI